MEAQHLSGDLLRAWEASLRRREPSPETSAFRWSLSDVPGVVVDRFGDVAVVHLYDDALQPEAPRLAEALQRCAPLRAVYVKLHPKLARAAEVDARPVDGEAVAPFLATEAGVAFEIRPDNGLSVGLYVDSSQARAWVRSNARGLQVLNLFAYTCGFGLVASLGGAARAVNVDASRKVLDWGQVNYRHNGLEASPRDFVSGDAFDWLGRFAKKQERFDLIVLDPPGFASTGKSRFSAARDYHRLVRAAADVRSAGGRILAMCNVESMTARDFEQHLKRGAPELRVEETFTQEAVKSAVLASPGARRSG